MTRLACVLLLACECQPPPELCALPPCNADRSEWMSRCLRPGECLTFYCQGNDAPQRVCR